MLVYRQPFSGEYPITQSYGEIVEGVTYKGEPHTGIDYGCPLGTPILAAADGTVKYASLDHTGYGNMVIIEHADGKATVYAHLSMISAVQCRKVSRGDLIGYSGQSGYATGPHLHFEARRIWYDYKTHEDPVTFLPLMSVDDSIQQEPEPQHKEIPEGKCRVACDYAYVRSWNDLTRARLLNRGDKVYAYKDVKYSDSGLPFRFIGAGLCIAEYDIDGTQILEEDNGD